MKSSSSIFPSFFSLFTNIVILVRQKFQGARVLIGGERVHPHNVEDGFYFTPAVITDVNDSMKVGLIIEEFRNKQSLNVIQNFR